MIGCGGDDDGVEGGLFLPAEVAVGVADGDVVVADLAEGGGGAIGQGGDDLDGVDLVDEAGEDGGLVAGAGADLEDFVFFGDTEGCAHEGDDVGLGDSLAVADGQGVVFVGESEEIVGDELVAGDLAHDLDDGRVGDAPGDEAVLDHRGSLGSEWEGGREGRGDGGSGGHGEWETRRAGYGRAGRGTGRC